MILIILPFTMSTLTDLIDKIDNPELKARISQEVNRLTKQKKFGLVFEEHLPECTPLYDLKVKKGSTVAIRVIDEGKGSRKLGSVNDTYTVLSIDGNIAQCERHQDKTVVSQPIDNLVVVAQFGMPIYPYLKELDSICNAPDSKLWHALIEADNYHALQLLAYLYGGLVDCIYIDPPYNTGAKDWKYNNDYVDNSDNYRHSKWLSMMQRRLRIAKQLLNPKNSVLIVTIDEKEYLHLGCLLEEMFPEARIQMVSTMINPANVARVGGFGRSGEYVYFVMFGESAPLRLKLTREWVSSKGRTHTGNVRWDLLKRSGTGASRHDSPGGFYPIYIDTKVGKIEKLGDPLPDGVSTPLKIDGLFALLPIRDNGSEGRWQWTKSTFEERMRQGRVKLGGDIKKGYTVYILKDGEYEKILKGEFREIGRGVNNEILTEQNEIDNIIAIPGDIWKIASHDSTQYGSRMLGNYFADKRFSFPKSLYAVRDAIRFFVADKPNALIVDFFAGSGTTLHAVNLLNAEDRGNRRCILVTNNEVSADEAKDFLAKGIKPFDDEWDAKGIARYVTWPRTICSIKGVDVNGKPLEGKYIDTDINMSDGFKANAVFYHLGFLNKNSVALGRQFKELLPLLWLKAGAVGECPKLPMNQPLPPMMIQPENKFAVLIDEIQYNDFMTEVNRCGDVETVYIVTDSDAGYREMAGKLKAKNTYQLYRDYLDNFRINRAAR